MPRGCPAGVSCVSSDLFLARQPIVAADLSVLGYELLYRAGDETEARFSDGDLASSQVLVSTFLEVGLERIVGSARAYLNMTRPFLVGAVPLPMAPEQVTLEVLEDVAGDAQVLEGLRVLRGRGYRVALDDFTPSPAAMPLLALADEVKLDVLALPREVLAELVSDLRSRGLGVIAERVETPEMFEHCRELGCTGFQGFFFCRPQLVRGRALPGMRDTALALIGELDDPEISTQRLEQLIERDVALAYRLLRYINCATFALRREVSSIREAIVMLGLRAIRSWATLILYARLEEERPRRALLRTALVRARMAERLTAELQQAEPGRAFTVGLFSTLDAVLGESLEDLLDSTPLSAEVKLALTEHAGPLGELLERTLCYERGNWAALDARAIDIGVHTKAYLEACAWADEQLALLTAIATR